MDPGGAGHLRDAGDRALDIRRRRLHQIGQLVDDDDDERHAVRHDEVVRAGNPDRRQFLVGQFLVRAFGLGKRLRLGGGFFLVEFGLGFRERAVVERRDVFEPAFGEDPVAQLHLIDQPTEREQNFFRVGDDRGDEVGQLVVDLHLDHFRVDHDEAELLGRIPEKQARDDRVDADAFAAPGGSGHEAVRHLREIPDDRVPVNIHPQGERKLRGTFPPGVFFEQLAEGDLHFFRVRDLDSHGVFARNRREDVDSLGAGGAGDVSL